MLIESARSPAGRQVVLAVHGELDTATAPDLRASLALALGGEEGLVLDLTGCTFMDVTGVRLLLRAHAEARQAGARLAIVCLPGGIPQRILDLVSCDALDVHPDRTSALRRFALPREPARAG